MAVNFNATPNPNHEGVKDISPEQLREQRKNVKIVDVRRLEEWTGEFGHIEEAELLTLNTLPEHIEELPKDQTIVFVCRSGGRSGQAAAFALQNGYESVYNMQGGMIAWTEKNFEVVDRNAN